MHCTSTAQLAWFDIIATLLWFAWEYQIESLRRGPDQWSSVKILRYTDQVLQHSVKCEDSFTLDKYSMHRNGEVWIVILQKKERADPAVHDAGHRQEGVADPLLHQDLLLLPLEERWGAYPWVPCHVLSFSSPAWIVTLVVQTFKFQQTTQSICCLPSRSKRGRRPSGWTMVSVCMRCAFLIYLKMNISWFLFWSAWGLRQGCDGGHPRHVGKHAVGF